MCTKSCTPMVEAALRSVPGVRDVVVSLEEHCAVVWGCDNEAALIEAVNRTGKVASLKPGGQGRSPLETGSDFQAIGGRGVSCQLRGKLVHVGNAACIREAGAQIPNEALGLMQQAQQQGETAILVAVDRQVIGVIALADTPRAEPANVMAALHKLGVEVYMATGDHSSTAGAVAKDLGIPSKNVMAEMLPDEKHTIVSELQKAGKVVAFVGDGVNDSQALVQADLGVAVGAGAEIAIDAADVILVRNNLWDVVTSLRLSRTTYWRICMNFVWALGYNVMGIPVAAGVFYPAYRLRLPPAMAAMAMAMSSVCVVLSSLMINRFQRLEGDGLTKGKASSLRSKLSLSAHRARAGGYSEVRANSDSEDVELGWWPPGADRSEL